MEDPSSLKLPAHGAPSKNSEAYQQSNDKSRLVPGQGKKDDGSSPLPLQSGTDSTGPEEILTRTGSTNRSLLSLTGSSDRSLLPRTKPGATSIRDAEVKQEAKQDLAALGEKKAGVYSVRASTSTSGVDTKSGAKTGTSTIDTKERASPLQLQMAAAYYPDDSVSGGSNPGAALTSEKKPGAYSVGPSTSTSRADTKPGTNTGTSTMVTKEQTSQPQLQMAAANYPDDSMRFRSGGSKPDAPTSIESQTPTSRPLLQLPAPGLVSDNDLMETDNSIESESNTLTLGDSTKPLSLGTIVAELATDTAEIEEERDDLRHQLELERQKKELVVVIEAVEVVKEEPNLLSTRNLVVCALVLVTVILVVVVVGVTVGGPDPTPVEEPFFDQIGSGLDGEDVDGQFGSSLSLSGDGATLAVASTNSVLIYRLEEGPEEGDDDASDWMPYGSAIMPPGCGGAVVDPALSESVSFALRSDIVVDLSRHGKTVAIGCPLSSSSVNGTEQENTGRVEIYQETDGEWELSGEPLFGGKAGDFLGASVSLSSSGTTLAVGTPGSTGNVQVFKMEVDEWVPHGRRIESSSLLISVGSVSMSADGLVLAVGGVSLAGRDSAVRMYRYILDDWMAMGNGIDGNLEGTAYVANLAGNGRIVAVSNYYVGLAGPAKGKLSDALDVRAFEWSENLEEWVIMGENLHGNSPGQKSGYFVTLSDDGLLMGMGDPGRRGKDEGAITGHAHVYWYDGKTWAQLGPNKYGDVTGDQFGYSVAFSGDGRSFAVAAPYSRKNFGYEHGRVSVFEIDLDGYM